MKTGDLYLQGQHLEEAFVVLNKQSQRLIMSNTGGLDPAADGLR